MAGAAGPDVARAGAGLAAGGDPGAGDAGGGAQTLGQDYVRTALAKGLTGAAALWRHAVPNALIPVVTILGLQFSFLLAGTVIIENVFALPGLGRLVFQAIAQRDLIVVQDVVLLLAASVILVNFAVDLASRALDPRLSEAGAR